MIFPMFDCINYFIAKLRGYAVQGTTFLKVHLRSVVSDVRVVIVPSELSRQRVIYSSISFGEIRTGVACMEVVWRADLLVFCHVDLFTNHLTHTWNAVPTYRSALST